MPLQGPVKFFQVIIFSGSNFLARVGRKKFIQIMNKHYSKKFGFRFVFHPPDYTLAAQAGKLLHKKSF